MDGFILLKKDGDMKTVKKSFCVRELMDSLEKIAHDYISLFQKTDLKFHKKSLSGKHGKHPLGYFMTSGRNKITIYNKITSNGWVFAGHLIKICSFYLVPPKCKAVEYEYNCYDFQGAKEELFSEIHDAIKLLCEEE